MCVFIAGISGARYVRSVKLGGKLLISYSVKRQNNRVSRILLLHNLTSLTSVKFIQCSV